MVRAWVRLRLGAAALVTASLGLAAGPAAAQVSGRMGVLREQDTAVIDDKGDAVITGRIVFPTEVAYLATKAAYPNPYVAVRNMIGSGGKTDLTDATVNYDDGKRCFNVTATQLGAAVCRRHHWQVDVGHGAELLHADGHTAVLLNVASMQGVTSVVTGKVDLPAGADHVKVDPDTGVLTYDLDRPAKAGTAEVEVDVKVKPRVMSALYKVYADPAFADGAYWTAKTVFTNTGTGDITHLKVRYRLGDYTLDWSPTSEYSTVAPGGHVVDLYYPLMKADVATLKSQSPVDLDVKYSYVDPAGKLVEDTTSKRITILGGNQFEYSNVPEEERTQAWMDIHGNDPLEAAFVTKMDDPVRSLGGMAAQACHGQPAGETDKAAVLFCKALYDLEVGNGLAYQWSVGDNLGKGNSAQSLKYPRDVLRDKSGTCIELALLYASVCESQGLHCYLVNIPGHCFPVVQLPSGEDMPVESTCISVAAIPDGKRKEPYTFQEAVQLGQMETGEMHKGPSTIVDVDDVQGKGVVCPELPSLPANVMQAWGWRMAGDGGAAADHGDRVARDDATPDHRAADTTAGGNPLDTPGDRRPDPQPTPPNNPLDTPTDPRPDVARADPRHPAAMCAVWTAQFTAGDGSTYLVAEQFKADGSYQETVQGQNGNNNQDKGTWTVDEKHNLVSSSSVSNTSETDEFRLDGDSLTVHNAEKNITVRFNRHRQ